MSSETYWAMRRREMAKHEPVPVKKGKRAKKEKPVEEAVEEAPVAEAEPVAEPEAEPAPEASDVQVEGDGAPSSEEAQE